MAAEVSIKYASMITLPGSSASDASIGMFSGSLCWITGGDPIGVTAYTNVPDNPVTGTPQEDWEIGMLTHDAFGVPSFDVNLDSVGTYGDLSELELRVNFVRLTSEWLYENSLYRGRVQFFVVVGGEFRKWCEQVVESFRFNATILSIYCMDISKDVHEEIPLEKTSRAAFPNIGDDQNDQFIPVTIGRVAKAKVLPVSSDGERLPMYANGSAQYFTTAANKIPLPAGVTTAYRKIYMRMITGDLVVAENQWAGKSIVCTRNGPNKQVEILSNQASSGGYTVIRLVEPFAAGNTDETIKYWSDENVPAEGQGFDASWFQLHTQEFAHIASHYPAYVFPNLRQVYFWDDDGKRFWSAYNLLKSAHADGIPGYGDRPGIITSGSDPKLSGAITMSYFPITPQGVTFVSLEVTEGDGTSRAEMTVSAEDFPVAGSDCPLLYDQERGTFLSWTADKSTASDRLMRSRLTLDVVLPDDFDFDAGLDGIFVAFNMSHEFNCADSVKVVVSKDWRVYGTDILRANSEAFDPGNNVDLIQYKGTVQGYYPNVFEQVPADNEVAHNGILDDYFGEHGQRGNFFQDHARFLLGKLSLDQRALENVHSVRVVIDSRYHVKTLAGVDEYTHIFNVVNKIHEITIWGAKKVDSNPKNLLIAMIGDKFQGEWGGRRLDGGAVLNIVDAAEQLIRQYDGQPTLIDTTTFDQSITDRPQASWIVGRQIWEGKNSIEYLRELCAEGHFCITPKHDGTRALRCWMDRSGGPLLDEDDIVEGSIGEVEDVDLRVVYNQFELRYDKNYVSGEMQRTVAVRNVDQAAFPAETDVVPTADGVIDIASLIDFYVRDHDRVTFYLTGPFPQIKEGTFVTLTGGAGGFALDKARVLEAQHSYDQFWSLSFFTVQDTGSYGMLTEGVDYATVGTATLFPNSLILWKTYVVGVDDYTVAKEDLWDPCHAAWALVRTKNTLRMDFHWFGSNADWGGSALDDGPVSWLKKAIASMTKPFKKARFQLPITLTNLALEVGQGVEFGHSIFTDGRIHYAWITSMVLNSDESRLDVEIIYNPWSSH